MWIRANAQISENVHQLTTAVSSHLLIAGENTALVDASVAAVQDVLVDEVSSALRDFPGLDYLLISHAHFDHVGAIPLLRRAFPELKVCASPQTAELLADRDYVQKLFELNMETAKAVSVDFDFDEDQWFSALQVDNLIRDGDTLALGADVEIKVIGSPGHTADSHCFLVRPDAILTGGESLGGYRGRAKYNCCYTSSYQDYVSNLDRLANLEIQAIGLPHDGAISGELVGRYLNDVREEAKRIYDLVKQRLSEGEVVSEIAMAIYPEWLAESIAPDGPFTITLRDTLEQMVQVIAEDR